MGAGRWPSGWCCAAALLLAGSAAGQAPPEADLLYEEGTRLLEQGDVDRACPKLAESHRLDPAAGALLALARCHEKAGRLATAWSTYGEAATLARAKSDTTREAAARNQMDLLKPRLPRLIVRLAPGWDSVRDAVIERNGIPVRLAEVGTPLLVDPGLVVIEARGAGIAAQRREAQAIEAQAVEVRLDPPARVAATVPTTDPADHGGGLDAPPLASWIAAGVGVVGIGLFTGFGIASADAASQLDACRNPCPPELEATRDAGARDQVIANVGLGVGLTGIVTAAVLWIAWPDDEPPVTASAAPGHGPGATVSLPF
jgi:hypothetical protein